MDDQTSEEDSSQVFFSTKHCRVAGGMQPIIFTHQLNHSDNRLCLVLDVQCCFLWSHIVYSTKQINYIKGIIDKNYLIYFRNYSPVFIEYLFPIHIISIDFDLISFYWQRICHWYLTVVTIAKMASTQVWVTLLKKSVF